MRFMRATIATIAASLVAAAAACSSEGAAPDNADSGTWGSVHCTNSSSTTNAQGECTRSYSGCSDGHSYGIDCAASSCTCRIDSLATGHGVALDCGGDGLAALATNCDWHQH